MTVQVGPPLCSNPHSVQACRVNCCFADEFLAWDDKGERGAIKGNEGLGGEMGIAFTKSGPNELTQLQEAFKGWMGFLSPHSA